MKTKLCLLFFIMLLYGVKLIAQPKHLPDSIHIEIVDHQSLIIFEMRNYVEDSKVINDFPLLLRSLIEHLGKSIEKNDLARPHTVEVRYTIDREEKQNQEIKIYPRAVNYTTLTVKGNSIQQLLPPGWEIVITDKHHTAFVYAPDFERLKSLSQTSLAQVTNSLNVNPEINRQKRMGLLSRIILSNEMVTVHKTQHRLPNDMIGLHAGAGFGILQDKLYPEFNVAVALYFSNRFRENNQRMSFNYELKFFSGRNAEGGFTSMPNTFLSASYARNFSKDRPRWTALGAGYLVNARGDIFKGRTIKLFLESDIGSAKLNIVPELYLTNNFKDALFGLKLNYKF